MLLGIFHWSCWWISSFGFCNKTWFLFLWPHKTFIRWSLCCSSSSGLLMKCKAILEFLHLKPFLWLQTIPATHRWFMVLYCRLAILGNYFGRWKYRDRFTTVHVQNAGFVLKAKMLVQCALHSPAYPFWKRNQDDGMKI